MRNMTPEKAANEIRRAYNATAYGRPNKWMGLALLEEMVDLTKEEITEGVLHLERTEVNFLACPESNQKALTERDREAEIIIGNQRQHLIGWM